jgi:hypothetical protein
VAVKLDGVHLERSRSFGAVWLGWILWRALKLDEQCEALLASKRETVGWAEVIAILVIGRLCEPSSELHVAECWYRSTALEDLLGVAVEDIYDERLYRALDRLLPHKESLEKHLVKRLGELFDLDYDLLLYDVTSTYFEGVADPAIAKRGYSRDHRPDCVQVNIALVVSREGMPLGYEIFAGNTTDVTTVQQIVEKMEDRFGKANRVWVMDRGMVSAENIAWLNSTGRRYVIGTARAELGRFTQQLTEKTDWHQIREDIEVKICRGPGGNETFLLCRSASRSEKEKAMHERFSQHIEEGLQSLGRRIAKSKKALDRGELERQIGRLLGQNSRAAARYSISLLEDKIVPAGVKLKQDRIKAHILICFLAYVLWKTLQQWQSRSGLGHSPRTILSEFSRIQSADIVLPLADGSAREIKLRCVVRPDREQELLLQRLGLTLPERLRPPAGTPNVVAT